MLIHLSIPYGLPKLQHEEQRRRRDVGDGTDDERTCAASRAYFDLVFTQVNGLNRHRLRVSVVAYVLIKRGSRFQSI